MKVSYEEIRDNKKIIIWGTGQMLLKYYDRLDPKINICAFCDTYEYKWSDCFMDGKPCISKNDISEDNAILIAIKDMDSIREVEKELDERKIKYCHILDAVKGYLWEKDAEVLSKIEQDEIIENDENRLVKFFDCGLPYTNCNFRCSYCYIRQHREFVTPELVMHSPAFIGKAFSKKRLGGTALINICGVGETLMCEELVPVVKHILDEGQYVSIVTNGTISKAFDKMIELNLDFSHLFFKFSLHYLELKRLGLLERFAYNVKCVDKAGGSFSIEIIADDNLIPYIDELKEYSISNFGALPHCLVPRDENKSDLSIITDLSKDEFITTWSRFESDLFDFKMEIIEKKQQTKYCEAGNWAYHMDLETGETYKCLGNSPYLENIYENIEKPIKCEAVGDGCWLPYCYNCQAYLAFGVVPEIADAPTYYKLRDRVTIDGKHWIKESIKNIFEQKIYNNC